MEKNKQRLRRIRLFQIISVGYTGDTVSILYDVVNIVTILLNLTVAVMDTFDELHNAYGTVFRVIEAVTVAFFAIDYVLRLITAPELYPEKKGGRAVLAYMTSFMGVVDLISFLPSFLPVFIPGGMTALRMVRVIRIFRLFKVNAYYDSLNVIAEVLISKKQQLVSSVFIILVLMLGSSLCMYSIEHEAQPDVFKNAFSGIWWATSTLLTVGYGDIYPVTPLGQVFGIFITFLGVGMVAIPTGIISAGFVEQYSRLKRLGDYAREENINFIEVIMEHNDKWIGKEIKDIEIPRGAIIAAIIRGRETLIPKGNTVLKEGDSVIIGAEPHKDIHPVDLKEITLGPEHPWKGMQIRDLDISRQTLIVMVRRNNRTKIPRGDTILTTGDTVFLYTKLKLK